MFIVTTVKTHVDPDPDKPGEFITTRDKPTASLLSDEEGYVFKVRQAENDSRVIGCRIFELDIDDHGKVSIGAEVTP